MKNKKYPHLKELFHSDRNAYMKEWIKLNPDKFIVKDEWRKLGDFTYNELPDDALPIPDFPTYYARPNGEIWRDTRGLESAIKSGKERILKLRATHNKITGYYLVQPYQNGKKTAIHVHRLILITFKGYPPQSDMECHHLDADTSNNCIDNLTWVTRLENAKAVPTYRRTRPKITLEQGRKISQSKHYPKFSKLIELYKSGLNSKEISVELDIIKNSVDQIIRALKKRNEL